MAKERILVVDDEPHIVRLCTKVLAGEDYQVQGVNWGREALALLESERFDLLLLDIMMPDLDGLTVLRQARQLDPEITAVIITGHDTLENTIEALRAGARGLVPKPFDPEDLLTAVSDALERRRLEQENLHLRISLPILEVSQALMSKGTTEQLTARLLDIIRREFEADRASLMLLDEEKDELYIAGAIGLPVEVVETARAKRGQSIAGWVLNREEPLILSAEAEVELPFWELLTQPDIASAVCMPLRTGERAIGVLTIVRLRGKPPFNRSDLNLLSISGGQIATALENARLYQEVARSREELAGERNLLRTLIDNLPDYIYVKDTESRFVIGNVAVGRVMGVTTPDELIGKTDFDLYPQELAAQYYANEQEVIRSGQPLINREEPLMDWVSNRRGWLLTTKVPLRDSEGKILGLVGIGRDITERKRAEEALRRAEQEKAVILDSMLELVAYQDTKMRILWANRAASESVGFAPEQLMGRHCYEIWHQRSKPCAGCPVKKALKTGQPQEAEMTTPDGRVWFIRGYPVRDAHGDIVGMVEVTLEITERKRAEEALRASEEKYRLVVENANEAIVVAQDGMLKFSNPKTMETTGYSKEELTSKPFAELIHPDDQETVAERHLKRLKGEELPHVYPFRIIDKEGNIKWVEINVVLINWEGRPATLTFLSDITERKRAEEKIRQQNEFLENVLESLTHPFYVIDANDYRIKMANSAAKLGSLSEASTCYALTHAKNKPCDGAEHPCPIGEVKKTKTPVMVEHIHYDEDGNARNFEIHSYPVFDSEGNVAQIIEYALDITEQRQMQASLIQTEKLAALGRLAASLAHEINNPLQALHSGLRLLLKESLEEEKRQRYLTIVNREVERLISIVERMLSFYRPSTERRKLTDINAVLIETLALAGKKLQHAKITVEKKLAAELPPVQAVTDQINQVFLNIILNAIDAMSQGGTLTLETGWEGSRREVWAAFTDSGEGIPAAELDKIFEPFYTTKLKGTGLGLSISYSIVERHGGRIEVKSGPGQGSTFTVWLPVGEGE